jgi:hypothetical protein
LPRQPSPIWSAQCSLICCLSEQPTGRCSLLYPYVQSASVCSWIILKYNYWQHFISDIHEVKGYVRFNCSIKMLMASALYLFFSYVYELQNILWGTCVIFYFSTSRWIKIIWSIITLTKLKMSFTTFYTYFVAFFSWGNPTVSKLKKDHNFS